MKRFWLLLIVPLVACLPIPDLRLEPELPPPTYRLEPAQVQVALTDLPGYPERHTPGEYNRAMYLRYFTSEPLETVLVLMPGLFGGATSLDIFARQLVASTPGLEVWVVERRANLLEDRGAARLALERGDPSIAYAHYVLGGFTPVPPERVRFMAYWGLDTHLRDLHVIVERARQEAKRVVLGGHSLGASLVSFYAAYLFGGVAGQDFLDGLLLIDGGPGRTGAYGEAAPSFTLGPVMVVPTVEMLERGEGSPYLQFLLNPERFAWLETVAIHAALEPDALAPRGLSAYPATNLAVFGLSVSDRTLPIALFGASVGEAAGAERHGNILAVFIGGLSGVTSYSVVGPAEGRARVEWSRGDPSRYRTDPLALARAYSTPEANAVEWYFPLRLLLDMSELDLSLVGLESFIPNREVTLPTLAVGAERGLVSSLDSFSAYQNVRVSSPMSAYILPGLTHLDIVMADENPLVPLAQLWLSGLP